MINKVSNLYGSVKPLPMNGDWSLYFDPEVYLALNSDLLFKSRHQAMMHFRLVGFRQLRQFSTHLPFDPDFYTSFYPDLQNFNAAASYKHWLLHGIAERRAQSPAALLEFVGYPSSCIQTEVFEYFEKIACIRGVSPWRLIEDFLRSNDIDDLYELSGKCSLNTLNELHSHFSDLQQKSFLCDVMHHRFPDDPRVLHLFADQQRAVGRQFSALDAYLRAASAGKGASIWCFVNAAQILASLKSWDRAIEIATTGLEHFPGNEHLRKLLRTSLMSRFDKGILRSRAQLSLTDAADSIQIFDDAVEAFAAGLLMLHGDAPACAPPNERTSIAIVGATSPQQCYDYRIRQKIEHFQDMGIRCKFFDWRDCSAFVNEASSFDIAIFFRLPCFGDVFEALFYANAIGVKTVYEIDDLILDPLLYPPAHVKYGNLVSEAEMSSLRFDAILFASLAKRCMFGIGSTEVIQNCLKNITTRQRAFVVENGLYNHELSEVRSTAPSASCKGGRVTLFYGSGSRSHSASFSEFLSGALLDVMRRYPFVDLTIIGPLALDEAFREFGDRVRHSVHLLGRDLYLGELRSASINLMPLYNDRFTSAKSNIKWLEAALFSIPTIASESETLKTSLTADEVLLCKNAKDWRDGLSRLVASHEDRAALGQRAYTAAVARYAPGAIQNQLAAFIAGVNEVHTAPNKSARRKSTRRKVLMVNVSFAPQAYGGATRVVLDDALDLMNAGSREFEVAVFTVWEGAESDDTYRLFDHEGILVCAIKAPQRTEHPEVDLGVADKFGRFLKMYAPDVVHFHCLQMLSASVVDIVRWKRIPYVITVHDGWWISDQQFLMHPDGTSVLQDREWGHRDRLERLRACLEGAKVVFAVSPLFASFYKSKCSGNIHLLENPSRPLEVMRRPASVVLRIGLIGGLGVAKGADLLKAALRTTYFANLEFDLVDHHLTYGAVKTEFWGKNSVRIIGRFPQDRVQEFYEDIDVLCAPSVCIESFGLAVREALNAGRWVIVSDRGALSSVVDVGRNGFIISVDNAGPLIRLLSMLNDDLATYKRDSSGLRTPVDADQRIHRLIDTYDKIIAEARPSDLQRDMT